MDDPTKMCIHHSGIAEKIDSLCDKIDERDKRYQERDIANKEALKAAFNSSERAAEKTEMALKEYKTASNEWRDTVKDLVSKMITRPDVERELKQMEARIAELRESRSETGGQKSGIKEGWGYAVGAVGLILIVISIMMYIGKIVGP